MYRLVTQGYLTLKPFNRNSLIAFVAFMVLSVGAVIWTLVALVSIKPYSEQESRRAIKREKHPRMLRLWVTPDERAIRLDKMKAILLAL